MERLSADDLFIEKSISLSLAASQSLNSRDSWAISVGCYDPAITHRIAGHERRTGDDNEGGTTERDLHYTIILMSLALKDLPFTELFS